MENKFTIKHQDGYYAGFGCYFFDIITGLAYAKKNNIEYVHSPIGNIKLEDKPNFQNKELNDSNNMINTIMNNLGIKVDLNYEEKNIKHFFHREIREGGVENYYTIEFLKTLQLAYCVEKSYFYKDSKKNIAIHVRRGDVPINRFIQAEVYDNIIEKLREKYPDYNIHVFCWGGVKLKDKNIICHFTDSGEEFLEHFNAFIHADILVVGSSSLSVVAGFFSKGQIMCHEDIYKSSDPYPLVWRENYINLMS
jgi:hypothetical protein